MAEQKFWQGPLQTLSASTKRSVKGQWNKNAEQKIVEQKFGGDPQGL